jgi:hypothetical protein
MRRSAAAFLLLAASCVSIPALVTGASPDAGEDVTQSSDASVDATGTGPGTPDGGTTDSPPTTVGEGGDGAIPCPGTYPQAVEKLPGLVGYWRLGDDTGPLAKDETGKHPGAYAGAVALKQPGLLVGDPDFAAAFDGDSGTYVAVPSSGELQIQTFTLGAIIKPSAIVASALGQQVVAKTGQYWLQLMPPLNSGSTAQLELGFIAPGAQDDYGRGNSSALGVGLTGHVVGTYDGQTIQVYVNGALAGAQPYTGLVQDGGTDLYIGSWDGTSHMQAGIVDEVFLTSVAIRADQVQALYNAAQGCAYDAGP